MLQPDEAFVGLVPPVDLVSVSVDPEEPERKKISTAAIANVPASKRNGSRNATSGSDGRFDR
jgi:hypothetical protein